MEADECVDAAFPDFGVAGSFARSSSKRARVLSIVPMASSTNLDRARATPRAAWVRARSSLTSSLGRETADAAAALPDAVGLARFFAADSASVNSAL